MFSQIHRHSRIITVTRDIFIAFSVLSAVLIATVAIFDEFRPNDKLILYPLLYSVIFSSVIRVIYLTALKQFLKFGYHQKSVLLIGCDRLVKQVTIKILSTPELGFRIQGILSDSQFDPSINGLHLGLLKQFPEILHDYQIDEVIIAIPMSEAHSIKRIVERCEEEGVRFCIVLDLYNIIPKWTVLSNLGEIPVIADSQRTP